MKRIMSYAMIIALIAISFSSCKKGENDPFLSLKSRTARLTGEWTLSSAEYTTQASGIYFGYDYVSTTVYTYTGSTMSTSSSTTSMGSTTTSTDSYPLTIEMEFEKDGNFSQTVNEDGNITADKGVWSWVYGNQELDLAKKEAVIITYLSGDGYNYSGTSIVPDDIIIFDKLSSDEVVVLLNHTFSDGTDTQTTTGTMTFTAE